MRTFDDLPEEIIPIIFSFLSLTVRKNVRLVCKKWLTISYNPSLINKDVFVIRDYPNLQEYSTNNVRCIINVRMVLVRCHDFSKREQLEFWVKYGPGIRSVYLSFERYQDSIVTDVLKFCPKLQRLTVKCHEDRCLQGCFCSELVRLLPKSSLVSLVLINNVRICPLILKRLTERLDSLKRLSLKSPTCPIDNILLNQLLDILRRRRSLLNELNLTLQLSPDQFDEIVDNLGPELIELNLGPGTKCLNDSSLSKMSLKLPNLKKISLAGDTVLFSDHCMTSFISNFTKLTHLNLRGRTLSDDTIDVLCSLSNLTCLDVSFSGITDEGMIKLFGVESKPKIIELLLNGLQKISDESLRRVSENLPNLRFLSLKDCSKLTSRSLDFICKYSQRLKCLFYQSHLIDIETSISYLKKLRNLVHLDLFLPNGYEYKFIDFSIFKNLELKELRVLIFDNVTSLNPTELKPIFNSCPSLEYIMVLGGLHLVGHQKIRKYYCYDRELVGKKYMTEWLEEYKWKWCEIPCYVKRSSISN